jgi:putative chitinase
VTPGIEQVIAAGVKRETAEKWLPHIHAAFEQFNITTKRQIAGWLAQTAHESGGFSRLEENLNYSADGMAAIWPNRFAVLGQDKKPVKKEGKNTPNKFALALHRKPEMIANVVYSNRMGNGSIESGDGWKYRGRGLKQLTGKNNYAACGKSLGFDLINAPDTLLEMSWAALSAAWFWSVNNCAQFADKDDFVGLTKRINGGTIGLEDRTKRYKAILQTMPD